LFFPKRDLSPSTGHFARLPRFFPPTECQSLFFPHRNSSFRTKNLCRSGFCSSVLPFPVLVAIESLPLFSYSNEWGIFPGALLAKSFFHIVPPSDLLFLVFFVVYSGNTFLSPRVRICKRFSSRLFCTSVKNGCRLFFSLSSPF